MLKANNPYCSHTAGEEEAMNTIIVAGDQETAVSVKQSLEGCGCRVLALFTDGALPLVYAKDKAIDFAVIDFDDQNSFDGIETAIELRRQCDIPPIVITGDTHPHAMNEMMRVEPLGYLTRPIINGHVELVVNLAKRLLQRNAPAITGMATDQKTLGKGFAYNYEGRSLYLNDTPVDLTPSELKLFDLCLRREGAVVPYETIVEHVWNGKAVAESTRRGLYHRLRNKLNGTLFETVNGIGCRVRLPGNLELSAHGANE